MLITRTPGVYIDEVSSLPPSVPQLPSAVPAFIGYTEKRPTGNLEAVRIGSMLEYEQVFGGPFREFKTIDDKDLSVKVEKNDPQQESSTFSIVSLPIRREYPSFWLYHVLQLYFANGGSLCYIISMGHYQEKNSSKLSSLNEKTLSEGLDILEQEDEPTLVLIPDAIGLVKNEKDKEIKDRAKAYFSLITQVLDHCAKLKDRFAIIDTPVGDVSFELKKNLISPFGEGIGINNLSYGAAYYPWLLTSLSLQYDESKTKVTGKDLANAKDTVLKYDTLNLSLLPEITDLQQLTKVEEDKAREDGPAGEPGGNTEKQPTAPAKGKKVQSPKEQQQQAEAKRDFYEKRSLYHIDRAAYLQVKRHLDKSRIILPPGAAMAGIYNRIDNTRGIANAPANTSLYGVIRPTVLLSKSQLAELNTPSEGKAINAIRMITGKGIMVWGARTFDHLSNEWRYISVRRYFLFVEKSARKAIESFVFEPNNENTWVRVRSMIENFLFSQWRTGALLGNKPENAFYVRIGLGETMTAEDIADGKLIVKIGLAVVRPAEFIILEFSHKLQEI